MGLYYVSEDNTRCGCSSKIGYIWLVSLLCLVVGYISLMCC